MTLESILLNEGKIHDDTLIRVMYGTPDFNLRAVVGHWYEDKILNHMDEPILCRTWEPGPMLTVYVVSREEIEGKTISDRPGCPCSRAAVSYVRRIVAHQIRAERSRREAREALNTVFGMEVTRLINHYASLYQDIDSVKGGD